ncbi:acyl-CoA dehydrogenase family protein [Kitasatospora cheerisanensis]|nr:acyl-CoA dehydrogenase family protein [Kitasatospora cheerisanensis]
MHVPRHLTFAFERLERPLEDGAAPCHRVPSLMVGAPMFAMPIVGAAQGALDAWRAAAPPHPDTERLLAESSARIDAARLLLERAARTADRTAPTPLLTARGRRDAATAAAWSVATADGLFHASGARVHHPHDPLQRHWRDITTAATHHALNARAAAAAYAEALAPS